MYSMWIYSIYTYKYTYLVRAKRGEKFILYYVYYTTLYCVHISLNLFSSARSAEKNVLYCVPVQNIISIVYKYISTTLFRPREARRQIYCMPSFWGQGARLAPLAQLVKAWVLWAQGHGFEPRKDQCIGNLCVDKIQSPRIGELCVDKTQSPQISNLCVEKKSPAHVAPEQIPGGRNFLFEKRSLVTVPITSYWKIDQ